MRILDLKRKGVKSITIESICYFYVEDIKNNFPELKIDPQKIILKNESFLIEAEYIHQKTQFDLMIEQTLKYRPKEDS